VGGARRSLLLVHAFHVTGPWCHKSDWETLRAQLREWLTTELEIMRTLLASLDNQELARRAKLEPDAPKALPNDVGALTWVLLAREICD
jgi:hypothetical protein